jgi:hypothetical protein
MAGSSQKEDLSNPTRMLSSSDDPAHQIIDETEVDAQLLAPDLRQYTIRNSLKELEKIGISWSIYGTGA